MQPDPSHYAIDACEELIMACLGESKPGKQSVSRQKYQLLSHFISTGASTLSSPTGQHILRTQIPSLFLKHRTLLHCVLAYSAAHHRYLQRLISVHDHAATYHISEGLRLYAQNLQHYTSAEETDAMFAACLLLTALFWLQDVNKGSWVLQNRATCNDVDWVKILSGPGLLIQSKTLNGSFVGGSWLPFLQAQNQARQTSALSGESNIPCFLYDACRTACDQDARDGQHKNDVYLQALQLFESNVERDFWADDTNFGIPICIPASEFPRLMVIPARLSTAFIILVNERDLPALLIMAFWFALICRLQHCQWWCFARAKDEGLRICEYIARHCEAQSMNGQAVFQLQQLFLVDGDDITISL